MMHRDSTWYFGTYTFLYTIICGCFRSVALQHARDVCQVRTYISCAVTRHTHTHTHNHNTSTHTHSRTWNSHHHQPRQQHHVHTCALPSGAVGKNRFSTTRGAQKRIYVYVGCAPSATTSRCSVCTVRTNFASLFSRRSCGAKDSISSGGRERAFDELRHKCGEELLYLSLLTNE